MRVSKNLFMKIVKKIRHIGIVTNNIKKSLWFYEKILGFKSKVKMIEYGKVTDKLTDINRAKIETLKLKSKNSEVMIELLQFKNKKINGKKNYNISRIGTSHFAVTVNNLEKVYKKLKKLKMKFICKPLLSNDKKVKLTFCRAPEGTLIEMVEELKNR